MRTALLLAVHLLLSCWALAGTGGETITSTAVRSDGSEIVYYLNRPSQAAYPLAVVLQGSECIRVSDKFQPLIAQLNASGVAVLRIEKPGLKADTPIGDCPPEYLRLNSIDRRVLDLLMVVARLRRDEAGWNGRLGLSGGSEGSMVVGIAAPLLTETGAVLLISSGGGSEFGEEVLASISAHMQSAGADEEAVQAQLTQIAGQWEEIARQPIPSREWASDGKLARNTYLWWNGALRQALYRPLLEVRAPIRVYQGSDDTDMTPTGSKGLLKRFQAAGRSNLELVEYQGGHMPPPEVLEQAFGWLAGELTRR